MFKKSMIALLAALALIAAIDTGANAQGNACEESTASAYARPRC